MEKENNEIVQFAPVSALSEITKGEIDIQISTAHRFPRSLAQFNERAIEMVSQDIETAESCIYHRPVGKEKTDNGKWVEKIVEGESIRLAEIVAACYGNIRVQAFIIEQTERQVIVRGMAHDLESNNAQSCEVIESTMTKEAPEKPSVPYSERMRIVTAKVALAKARRDATFMVVPKALCKKIVNSAKAVIAKSEKPLNERIAGALAWFDGLKIGGKPIDRKRLYELLNVKGEADIGLDELYTLTGLRTSIKEEPESLKEIFAVQVPVTEKPRFAEEPEKDEKGKAKKTEPANGALPFDKAK